MQPTSQAAALAWAFHRRHRWGFVALAVWLGATIIVRLVAAAMGRPFVPVTSLSFSLSVVIPGTLAAYWMLTVFTYGQSGNLGARQSIYPARLFTLPVANTALTAWPMLYGGAALALLWIAVRIVAPWPSDLPISVPHVWPGLMAIVLLAWTQALTWMSYPLPGLRVIAVVLGLVVVEVSAVLAIEGKATEPMMIAMLAPQLPLAYLVARHAVARARRGDVTDWSGAFDWLARATRRYAGAARPFASPMRAQGWLEWQRHGRSLPMPVAFVLPVELLLLWIAPGAPKLLFMILLIIAVTPPFLASFTAMAARKSSASDGDSHGLSPFIAARPLSSAALVGAKLRMAARSTAVAWVLVLAVTPAAMVLSGTWPMLAERARAVADVVGTARAAVFALLVIAAFVVTTWRQMVQSLYIGLTGRAGLIRGSAIAMLVLIVFIGPILDWAVDSSAVRRWIWVVGPVTLAVLALLRMISVSWIIVRLHRGALVTGQTLLAGAAAWLFAVLAVYGTLAWLFGSRLVPQYLLALVAMAAVPLVRVSAAPLALDWNRHR